MFNSFLVKIKVLGPNNQLRNSFFFIIISRIQRFDPKDLNIQTKIGRDKN